MMFLSPRLSPLSSSVFSRFPASHSRHWLSHLPVTRTDVSGRSCSQLHRLNSRNSVSIVTSSLNMRRRQHSTKNGDKMKEHNEQGHDEHSHSHSHSRSIFGGHSHAGEYNYGAERIMAAWEGTGDRGSRITIIGLLSNICLTGLKGTAGWYLHSAALLAEAGHSLSDLMGDFVTLFCWKLSRKPPSSRYPFGFAKFETLGTTTVSLILVGGALGIGFHSYHILLTVLSETAATLPAGPIQSILHNVTTTAPDLPQALAHHSHVEAVDPNAAWFAALSVLVKEWLYRVTKSVAEEENSPVLLANAVHHRSDSLSSLVALFAILGSWIFPKLPLDPIGGLLISFVILKQGTGLLAGAWADLTDASVPAKTKETLKRTLDPLLASPSLSISKPAILAVSEFRARRAGSLIFVDLTADVPSNLTVQDLAVLEEEILQTLQEKRKEVKEIRVKFKPTEN